MFNARNIASKYRNNNNIIIIVIIVPDPCLSAPCDANALCEREGLLTGNFSCSCQAPFLVGDGFNCASLLFLHCDLICYDL